MPFSLGKLTDELIRLMDRVPLSFKWHTGRQQPPVEIEQIVFWEDVEQDIAKILMRRKSKVYVFTSYLYDPGDNITISIANHAHRHATGNSLAADVGADPLGPYSFTWLDEHLFAPLSNALTPITLRASSGHTADLISVENSAFEVLTVMDEQGDVAIGTSDTADAHLTVQARQAEAVVISLGPFLWLDANDPDGTGDNSAYSDGDTVDEWQDKSGNARHIGTSLAGLEPQFWRTAGADPRPSVLPGSGLPVMGTKNNPSTRSFADFQNLNSGTANQLTGSYTVFVMAQVANNTAIELWLSGREDGDATGHNVGFIAPNFQGVPDVMRLDYQTGGPGLSAGIYYVSGQTDQQYNRWTLRRDGATHAMHRDDTALAVQTTFSDISLTTAPLTWRTLFRVGGNLADPRGTPAQAIFCEIIVFDYALSDAERALVWAYLDEKWVTGGPSTIGKDIQHWRDTSAITVGRFTSAGLLGVGTALDPTTRLHVVDTVEQVRIGYDLTNYLSVTIDPSGDASLDLIGTTPLFTFADPIIVNDYIRMPESSGDPTGVANAGHLYVKDVSTVTELFFRNSASVIQLTSGGDLKAYTTVKDSAGAAQTQRRNLKALTLLTVADVASDTTITVNEAASFTWTNPHTWNPGAAEIPININANASQSVDMVNLVAPDGSDNVAVNLDGILRLRDVSGLTSVYPGAAAPYGGLQDYGSAFSYGILYGMFSSLSSQTELHWNNEGGVAVQITSAGRVFIDQFFDYNWQVEQTFGDIDAQNIKVDNITAQDGDIVTINGDNLFVDSGHIRVEINATGDVFFVGGVFGDNFTDAPNVTTNESDLHSYTLIGNLFAVNGDKVSGWFGGLTLGHATDTTQLRVYLYGTVIWDSTAINFPANSDWMVYVEIIRDSSSSLRCITTAHTTVAEAGFVHTQYTRLTGLTLSNSTAFKITGQRAGGSAASNDILAKMSSISFLQANA